MVRLTEQNIKEIAMLFKDGKNVNEVAESVGCSKQQVEVAIRKLRKLGVELPSRVSSYAKVADELKQNKD